MLISFIVLGESNVQDKDQKFKMNKGQEVITPKLGKTELRYLCTAHRPTKFNVDNLIYLE
jgi:hypothetical protein